MSEMDYEASPAQAIERLRDDLDEQTVFTRVSTATSASDNSGAFPVNRSALAVDIDITALTGTTPSATFFLDRQGADGVFYRVWTSPAVTAIGQVSTSIGAGLAVNALPTEYIRLGWDVAGTVTFSASVVGR